MDIIRKKLFSLFGIVLFVKWYYYGSRNSCTKNILSYQKKLPSIFKLKAQLVLQTQNIFNASKASLVAIPDLSNTKVFAQTSINTSSFALNNLPPQNSYFVQKQKFLSVNSCNQEHF